MSLYQVVNTDTDEIEGTQEMTAEDAKNRNDLLRSNGEPQRWVPVQQNNLDDNE